MSINVSKLRPNSLIKYRAIQNRFKELYDGHRIRVDDVYEKLGEEFFLSEIRLYEILRLDLPKRATAKDPAQISLFGDDEEE